MAQVIGIGPDTKRDDTVYDPTCGSGSLLIKAADEAPNGLTIYGQEKDVATWTMACMNMILHGRVAAEIKRDNTLAAPRFTDGPGRLKSTPPSPWVALDFAGSQVQGARTMRMRPWKRVRSYMTMVTLAATGCAGDSSDSLDWPGTVEADVDDLTGERTGLFRTYGPTAIIVAGRDTVPVTVGHWCQVQGAEYQPLTAVDGMFLKVSLADTSLISSGTEAFVELRGTLGLLDLARMAVDGHVSPWRYDPMPELGAWYLDGAMGYVPDEELDTSVEREALVSALRVGYDLAGDLVETNASSRMSNSVLQDTDQAVSELRLKWAPATDYVASHYFGRNTLGVELKGVVKFSLRGFSAAADSVRFWCPVPQSHHEWNAARVAFFGRIDSLQAASTAKIASLWEERRANARAAQERAHAVAQALEDSLRAVEDSLRALGFRTHRVRPGESLYGIARAYGVTVDRLKSLNNLGSSRLHSGQVLRLPPKG